MNKKPQALIEDEENRRIRLRWWINQHYDGVVTRFCKDLGVSQGEVSSLLLGTRAFGELKARTLEEQARMPDRYLDQREIDNDSVNITLHSLNTNENNRKLKQLVADKKWFEENLPGYTSFANLKFMQASGDSMKPTINQDDIVFIDTGINKVNMDGIYLLETNGHFVLKRVSLNAFGQSLISSDNPAIKNVDTVDLTTENKIKILGKVLRVWTNNNL